MYFYNQLKDLRKQKGFTIREVAKRSGVSSAYISQLENGNRGVPSPEILMKLSDGLKISYAQLMQLAGYLDDDHTADMRKPVEISRLLREHTVTFDGRVLTDNDKDRIDQMLFILFGKQGN